MPDLTLDTIKFDDPHRITGSPIRVSGGIQSGATGSFNLDGGVALGADQTWLGNSQEFWSVTGISGNHELTLKNNPDVFFISGSSTNTANTIVEGGNRLALNVEGLILEGSQFSGPLTLHNAAMHANTRAVRVGRLAATTNSKVVVNNIALTSTNGVELQDSLLRLKTDCDNEDSSARLDVQGAVVLRNVSLEALPGYAPSFTAPWTIVRNDGRDPVVGSFNSLPEGATFTTQCANVDVFEVATFRVSYRGGDGNDVTLTRVDPMVRETFKYVALGDSYSSGEGVKKFFDEPSKCHRSQKAYATLIRPPQFSRPLFDLRASADVEWGFQACTGAVTEQVVRSLNFKGDPLPQLALGRGSDPNPNDLAVDKSTDLVTITIGGNNVDFEGALRFCWSNAECQDKATAATDAPLSVEIPRRISAQRASLSEVYRRILEQTSSAEIVVLGYPHLFPRTKGEAKCTKLRQHDVWIKDSKGNRKKISLGFSINEQDMMRKAGDDLNRVIREEVQRIDSPRLRFVPVADHFAGHEVCGNGGEWVNGPSVEFHLSRDPVRPKDQSFHPNVDGHVAYARCVNAHLKGTGVPCGELTF